MKTCFTGIALNQGVSYDFSIDSVHLVQVFLWGKTVVLKKLSCQHLSFGREFLKENSLLFYMPSLPSLFSTQFITTVNNNFYIYINDVVIYNKCE